MTECSPQVQVFAIIPAAGQSTRMGRCKQLMPMGEGAMLECVIETALHGEIDGLCVVTSSMVDEELALSEDPRFIVAINDDGASEMLDSIRMGMAVLKHRCQVAGGDGYLVCPGDMPRVTAEDVCTVTHAFRKHAGDIVIAAHGGTRGHPMVFPASLAGEVERIGDGGLKVLIEHHADSVRLVECDSSGVIEDLDTPEDYNRLKENA
ncbi:MAG: nucleotidyltransferase family protein [Phycisphaerae bacterium]|nr:nucleotidyltransferase family protein [Phycisphaerae bacterium]